MLFQPVLLCPGPCPPYMEQPSEVCPVCRADAFLNPAIHFLLSTCYHRVCSDCVDRLYAHGSAPCPVCAVPLRRSAFHSPTFSDVRVEKECRIRRLVAASLNKREEDFVGLKEWNDYLEEVEDIVFKLVEDVDTDKIYAKLDAIRRESNDQMTSKKRVKPEPEEAVVQPVEQSELKIIEELEAERAQRRQAREEALKEVAATGRYKAPRRAVTADADIKLASLQGMKSKQPVKRVERREVDPLQGLGLPELPAIWDFPVPEIFLAGGLSGKIVGEFMLRAAFCMF